MSPCASRSLSRSTAFDVAVLPHVVCSRITRIVPLDAQRITADAQSSASAWTAAAASVQHVSHAEPPNAQEIVKAACVSALLHHAIGVKCPRSIRSLAWPAHLTLISSSGLSLVPCVTDADGQPVPSEGTGCAAHLPKVRWRWSWCRPGLRSCTRCRPTSSTDASGCSCRSRRWGRKRPFPETQQTEAQAVASDSCLQPTLSRRTLSPRVRQRAISLGPHMSFADCDVALDFAALTAVAGFSRSL